MTVLRKLLKDQDPMVIRSLLLNPRLTESEVLKIASLRPTSPRILEEVFHNATWVARYRVKKALVCNPYSPPSIAVHLLKFLLLSDLREIAQFENLHLAVKEIAHQLLRERMKWDDQLLGASGGGLTAGAAFFRLSFFLMALSLN